MGDVTMGRPTTLVSMSKCRNMRGSAVVESAFMMPWLAFLFIGILDVGFFYYAAICTQEAARVSAIQYASSPGSDTCVAAIGALNGLPNMIGVTTCAASPGAISAGVPEAVVYKTLTNSTTPTCADCALDPTATSAQVAVTYRTIPLIPIPGILVGQLTITRTAEVRILE